MCVEETLYGFLTTRKFESDATWTRKSSEELDEYVISHPFARQEIIKQQEDLQRLKEAEILDRELLEWLRTSYNNDGKSLIDLS